jgi:ribosomal protein S1
MSKKAIAAIDEANKKKYPKGTKVTVESNEIAGQGNAFVGLTGKVTGYCYGDIVVLTREGELCFHPSEVSKGW